MYGRMPQKRQFQVTNVFDQILCVERFAVWLNHYDTDLLRCILPQQGTHYGRILVDIGNFDPKLTAKKRRFQVGGSSFKFAQI